MFFMTRQGAYILLLIYTLFVAFPFGAAIGWGTGKVLKELLHETEQRNVLHILLGFIGFLSGTLLAFIGFSLEERFHNGELVYRKVTGLADFHYLVAATGAALIVIFVELSLRFITKYCRRQHRLIAGS